MKDQYNSIYNSKNWKEFKENLVPFNKTDQGRIFEDLTLLYLKTEPSFKTKINKVWHHSDIPQEIIDELGLQRPEIGVDLLAKVKDGSYWAIQCKYHQDQNRNVSYKELSTFFSITERFKTYSKLSHRLVCTSSNQISKKIEKAHPDKIGYLTSSDFSNLDSSDFKNYRNLIQGNFSLPLPYKPKPHQHLAIKKCKSFFNNYKNTRGKLIHPCGSGKSLTGFWISQELNSKTILIAVPSLALVRQTLGSWSREAIANKIDIDWIAVCSDDDVKNADDPLMQKVDLGIKVDTDPEFVADFFKLKSNGIKVVVTTYQSGHIVSEGLNKVGKTIDLGIFDEAHKTVGQKDKRFAHLLNDKNAKIDKRVFMTATERQFKGNSDEYLSMDDPDIYGTIIDQLSFKAALEAEESILSDYKIVTTVVSRSEISEIIEDNHFIRLEDEDPSINVDASSFAAMIALRKLIKERNIKHSVSFHNSIKRAKDFKNLNEKVNKINKKFENLFSYHVSGADSTGLRAAEIQRFISNEPSLITNSRCLTEGVDVPAIDAVLFADSKQSKIDIVQAAGRALRKFKGKDFGYILVPVIFDENTENSRENAFKQIISVISALGMNDERIIEEYKLIAKGKKVSNPIVEIDVPDIIKVKFSQFISEIEIRIWDRLSFGWGKGFNQLLKYVDTNHHAKVPSRYIDDSDFALGSWVNHRRQDYKKGKLSLSQIQELESLKNWSWNPIKEIYHESFISLKNFVNTNHHARVPSTYIDDNGLALGSWVNTQRGKYNKGTLSLENIKQLESVKGWLWDPINEDYQKRLEQLLQFEKKHGHISVPKNYIDDEGHNLSSWIYLRRKHYRDGKLTDNQVQQLESIEGWAWDANEEKFQIGFNKLKEFFKKNQNIKVPKARDKDGYNLGEWIRTQRKAYKNKNISFDRIQKLESLDYWSWNAIDDAFENGFNSLKNFVEENNHARVPNRYIDNDGYNLGSWVSNIRFNFRNGKLSKDQIKKLETVNSWFWESYIEIDNKKKFQKGINYLEKFIKTYNHSRVPNKHTEKDGFMLGQWTSRLRADKKIGILKEERIHQLESLNGWIWDIHEDKFQIGFELLQKYVNEHSAKVPNRYVDANGFQLGNWASVQRKNKKNGMLTKERIHQLESLNGWIWDIHEDKFQTGLRKIKAFLKNNKGKEILKSHVDEDGYRLGNWVGTQRTKHKKGTLSKEHFKQLDDIRGWVWDARKKN